MCVPSAYVNTTEMFGGCQQLHLESQTHVSITMANDGDKHQSVAQSRLQKGFQKGNIK
jgi:hypothetical protein